MSKKFRFKPIQQKLRQRANKVEKIAVKHHRKFFVTSLDNLRESRLLIAGWLVIVIALILIIAVQSFIFSREIRNDAGVAGGTYAEGVIGEISNINPLFTVTESEVSASKLIYSSLLRYDSSNHLRGEVAESYTISNSGLTYNVKIRDGISWHDGSKLTIDDVIFTMELIKDPLTTSPLYSTWRNIKVEKSNKNTVKFTLLSPLASFPAALTFGILPKSELKDIEPAKLREYTSEHIVMGSGPFKYRSITVISDNQKTLSFTANKNFWRYSTKIDNFYLKNYKNSEELLGGFITGDVTGAVGLLTKDAQKAVDNRSGEVDGIALDSGVFAIFNMKNITDKNIRKALLLASDRTKIRELMSVGDIQPGVLDAPVAPEIYRSVDKLRQANFNKTAASKLINKKITLDVVTLKDSDLEIIANELAEQWRSIGINVRVKAVDSGSIQQNFLIPRNYDVLIAELQLGADADVYAYWHSSGIKPQGLNFANYSSPIADLALFNARTTLNVNNREQRTRNFVEQWLADIPAVALYQPNLYYLRGKNVKSITQAPLASESDRYRDVYRWTVETRNLYKTP